MTNSNLDICNLAVGHLGNTFSISNIDNPITQPEKVLSRWYDVSRKSFLRELGFNFSLARKVVAKLDEVPEFGYLYGYEYPSDCLKVLGIGSVDEKENNFSIESLESGALSILTYEDYQDGLKLRYIKDVPSISLWSDDAKILFSYYLAQKVALQLTQDAQKAKYAFEMWEQVKMSASAISAQENRPIRKDTSKFKASRLADVSYTQIKY